MYTPAADESMSVNTPEPGWFGADTPSANSLDDLGAAVLSRPAAHPPKKGASTFFQGHADLWSAAHGSENFFDFPLTQENPASDSIPTPLQLLNRADSLSMMYAAQSSGNDMLEVDFFDSPNTPRQPVQRLSATSSLIRLGEKLERQVSAMGDFLADPRNVVEDCAQGSMDSEAENPVAIAIMCTKELTDIIQNLKASARPAPSSSSNSQPISPTSTPSSSVAQPESLSTETTLLILSSYLQLMRLYDSIFHIVYQTLSKIPAETIKSLKVKAVFHIAGIPSLQDMPGNAYAKGVVEVIQSHIQTLERCMGLPAVYCLSSDAVPTTPKGGIFADVDRARLLHTTMAQDDVISPRGNKSYAESIRENVKNSVALFGS
jgi:hypothetical protein